MTVAAPQSLTIGEFELTPLSDGFFRLDGGAMFGVVPKPLWEQRAPADEKNRITLGLRPLLVRAAGRRILIDAGIGDKLGAKPTAIYAIDRARHLDHSLAAAGLTAADIDVVIATHLHFDHAGGFTTMVDGVARPRFPNARYLIRRAEWDDAMHPHERNRASYFFENYVPLAEAGVVDFHDDDEEVLPGISVWRTGGHTMHHELVKIQSNGDTAVFTADLMPTAAHVDEAWIMGYDLYPMDTLAFKRAFLREAIAGEYAIFFEHDPRLAAGIIRETNGRKSVEPVIADPQ
jgi:glyoxylase-like metal-dependent hydrolase (beta-lactamase superfamily II)